MSIEQLYTASIRQLARFEPLRRFGSRLDSVLLPMRALRQLLSNPSSSSTDLFAT